MKDMLRFFLVLVLVAVIAIVFAFGCKQAGQLRFGDEAVPNADQIENALIPFAKPNVQMEQGEQAVPEQGVDVCRTLEVPLPLATPPAECDFGQTPLPNVKAYLNAKAFFESQPYQALMSAEEFAKKVTTIEETWKTNLETISDVMFFCLMNEEKKCVEKIFIIRGSDYKPFFDNLAGSETMNIGDIVVYKRPKFWAFQKEELLFVGTSAYISVAAVIGSSILNCYQPIAGSIISLQTDMPKPFIDKIQNTGLVKIEGEGLSPAYRGGVVVDVNGKYLEIILKFYNGADPFIGFDTKVDLTMIDWNNLVKKLFESTAEEAPGVEGPGVVEEAPQPGVVDEPMPRLEGDVKPAPEGPVAPAPLTIKQPAFTPVYRAPANTIAPADKTINESPPANAE